MDSPNPAAPTKKGRLAKGQQVSIYVVALIMIAALGAQTSPGDRFLRSVGLKAAPPEYSELFFEDPDDPFSQAERSEGSFSVPFLVRNHEGDRRTYEWSVALEFSGRRVVVREGTVTAESRATARVPVQVAIECAEGAREPAHIEVRLDDPSLEIHRLIACPPQDEGTSG